MQVSHDPVFVRRRRVALLVALTLMLALIISTRWVWAAATAPDGDPATATSGSAAAQPLAAAASEPATQSSTASPSAPPSVAAPKPSASVKQGDLAPSGETTPVRIQRLSGNLASKSVDASVNGLVFAQNMMYQHSISVFGADGALLKTIPDTVDLSRFGIAGHPGLSKGAPVEMAFSPDGRTAWVSNYHMYGEGFSAEPKDTCSSGDGATNSFLYKVDTSSLEIVKVVEVGVVPKYVAVTPDGKRVLVTNWCSMDINVIDTATDTVVATVPSGGRYPRGIAVAKDSRTAYVALMGSSKVIALDLTTMAVRDFATPGSRTRHLTMSPDGTKVYATNSGDNNVVELDAATGAILRKVTVGAEPRSMTVSADGGALYVVNYDAATMSKIRISDFTVVATLPTDGNPIGITYEPTKKAVWVACYGGTILVFDDSRKAA
ncbi:MAG TPA: YncE family protein [Phycicoccus sp.]|jgi:YVTN family beta-propeller protein|nr:YncE family protein [Phycicoccus sp.]HQY97429.1 YncE family protein [Phycicoccus sp.]HRA45364.1 YncE family protein [Phycicoccus sp.]